MNEWQETYEKSVATEHRRLAMPPSGALFVVAGLIFARVVTWILPSPWEYLVGGSAAVLILVGSITRSRRRTRRQSLAESA